MELSKMNNYMLAVYKVMCTFFSSFHSGNQATKFAWFCFRYLFLKSCCMQQFDSKSFLRCVKCPRCSFWFSSHGLDPARPTTSHSLYSEQASHVNPRDVRGLGCWQVLLFSLLSDPDLKQHRCSGCIHQSDLHSRVLHSFLSPAMSVLMIGEVCDELQPCSWTRPEVLSITMWHFGMN